MEPVIIVHGGAAIIEENRVSGKLNGVQEAVIAGYNVLKYGGSAADAVQTAIKTMEDNEYFNAGFGAVLNVNGEVEMDASIMEGKTLSAGACALVKNVKNPINLANTIREKSFHVLLAGDGASEFAASQGIKLIPKDQLVSEYSQHVLEVFKQNGGRMEHREMGGTVGCVALDSWGDIAAGTSTGGTNGKLNGRVGDTPLIGSGTYADNNIGGVSSTGMVNRRGDGEAIIRCCNAFSIIKDMEQGVSAQTATKNNIKKLSMRTGRTAGAITIGKNGDVGFSFSTRMMPWAYIKAGELHFGYKPEQDEIIEH